MSQDGLTVDAAKNTGNIARQTTTIPTTSFVQTYRYDAVNRLTEAKETTGGAQNWKQTFGYDRFGNRTYFSQTTGSTQLQLNNINHPSIDPQTNRFTTGQGYIYDFNGNLIQDAEGRTFTFNGDDKQIQVKDANQTLIGTYLYDGEGQRVKKVTATETTIFVYDAGGALVAEYSTVAPPPTPTTNYLTTDHLGSPRVVTDSQGQVTARRDFMPFGEELLPDGTHRTTAQKYGSPDDRIRQKFTGYQKDEETQLDFAEARMYQNKHGRFTAVDPLLASGKSADPQTFNRYVYCLNNPLSHIDPSGMQVGKHVGKVYTDEGGTRYTPDPFEGSHQFKGAKYVEGADGFTYSVTTGGFYSIGRTADINARGDSLLMADSRVREEAYANSFLPSAWIPELQIDPPGYAEASNPRGGRFAISADGETELRYGQDSQRAFALAVGVAGGLGGAFGGTGAPPSVTKSSSPIGGNFAERLFFSQTFGKESTLFGNSRFDLTGANRAGMLNQPKTSFKMGWSNTIAEMNFINPKPVSPIAGTEGGMQFRIGFGAKSNSGQAVRHLYVPRTFVPESRSNPFAYRRPKAN